MTDTSYTQAENVLPEQTMRLWQKIVCRIADRIVIGSLLVRFADGQTYKVFGSEPGPSAELHMKNFRPVRRLLTSGDLGFARSYIDGDWDSPDLGNFLKFALANEAPLNSLIESSAIFGRFEYLRHRLRKNSRKGSRRNIAFHYDLGNEFYAKWLDETMTYSAALYEHGEVDLEEAQTAKYARIVDALDIGPGDHVLEIGCGWGGFAEYAIARTGCHVTGLTLSNEQAAYAKSRLEKAGLADRADIRLEDYRDCSGEFDKVVSIEMFEAVGEENWLTYFETVRARLKVGGEAMVQSITIDEQHFGRYRRNADFIQTHIFPGGMLPTVTAFTEGVVNTGMRVKDSFGFGLDYAKTLVEWEKAFVARWDEIKPLGFDEHFHRMWRYYLHYCATGFAARRIDVFQFHLAKMV